MGDKPSPKHTLDRRDNNGNYDAENCRWATKAEQKENVRQPVVMFTKNRFSKTMELFEKHKDWNIVRQKWIEILQNKDNRK